MAPLIAALVKWGLPMIASAVMSKGTELVQEKLGVDLTEALGSEEGRIHLKQLEVQHEEFLVNAAMQSDKLEVEDRAGARASYTSVATSENAPWYDKSLLPVMSYLVTLGFFGCMGALFYVSITNAKLDDNSRDILIYAFGAMTAGWMTIMNFLFGASRGGRENQAALQDIAKKQKDTP